MEPFYAIQISQLFQSPDVVKDSEREGFPAAWCTDWIGPFGGNASFNPDEFYRRLNEFGLE